LIFYFYEKYAYIQTKLVRDFSHKIDWSNRFIGIKVSRGVGKTTFVPDSSVLFVSLDDLYFTENKLYDLADRFHKKGGQLLAIDEVHRGENWAIELKNIMMTCLI